MNFAFRECRRKAPRSTQWLPLFLFLAFGVPVSMALARPAPSAQPGQAGQAGEAVNYHIIKRVVLGGEGFWDYMGFDNQNRHLFVSHGTHVMVVDANTFKVVGDIPDTQGVHGIAVAPELDRGFISDGGADQVTVFNLKTLKTVGTVKVTGHNPDCIAYDPASKRVFTFNGRSGNATAIDAKTLQVAGTIGGRTRQALQQS
jgi:DNA-binding beta-propeller fold protein YncE